MSRNAFLGSLRSIYPNVPLTSFAQCPMWTSHNLSLWSFFPFPPLTSSLEVLRWHIHPWWHIHSSSMLNSSHTADGKHWKLFITSIILHVFKLCLEEAAGLLLTKWLMHTLKCANLGSCLSAAENTLCYVPHGPHSTDPSRFFLGFSLGHRLASAQGREKQSSVLMSIMEPIAWGCWWGSAALENSDFPVLKAPGMCARVTTKQHRI